MRKGQLMQALDEQGVEYDSDMSKKDLQALYDQTSDEAPAEKEMSEEQKVSDKAEAEFLPNAPRDHLIQANTGEEDFNPDIPIQSYGVSSEGSVNTGDREYQPNAADVNHPEAEYNQEK